MPEAAGQTQQTEIFTIGHSTLELSRFVANLSQHEIACVCDVRRFPRSRRFAHFDHTHLAASLADTGIDYVHLAELGGRRKASGEGDNAGWRSPGFRAYADHMATAEFDRGFARLVAIAERAPTAVMCAEAAWWRCHRRLVADALEVRGFRVIHIASDGRKHAHERTPFLVTDGGRLRYPPPQASFEL